MMAIYVQACRVSRGIKGRSEGWSDVNEGRDKESQEVRYEVVRSF